MNHPSYHDLHITTATIQRTSIFNLPFNLTVACSRIGGWELWDTKGGSVSNWVFLAGEYGLKNWLVLDVDGVVIVDSRRKQNG